MRQRDVFNNSFGLRRGLDDFSHSDLASIKARHRAQRTLRFGGFPRCAAHQESVWRFNGLLRARSMFRFSAGGFVFCGGPMDCRLAVSFFPSGPVI